MSKTRIADLEAKMLEPEHQSGIQSQLHLSLCIRAGQSAVVSYLQ